MISAIKAAVKAVLEDGANQMRHPYEMVERVHAAIDEVAGPKAEKPVRTPEEPTAKDKRMAGLKAANAARAAKKNGPKEPTEEKAKQEAIAGA